MARASDLLVKISGPSLGLLAFLSGFAGVGCVGPLPTESIVITADPGLPVKYVSQGPGQPYAYLWNGNRLQVFIQYHAAGDCPFPGKQVNVSAGAVYDATVGPQGEVNGTLVLSVPPEGVAVTGGTLHGVLGGGFDGLATMDVTEPCGSVRISTTLALVPEVPLP